MRVSAWIGLVVAAVGCSSASGGDGMPVEDAPADEMNKRGRETSNDPVRPSGGGTTSGDDRGLPEGSAPPPAAPTPSSSSTSAPPPPAPKPTTSSTSTPPPPPPSYPFLKLDVRFPVAAGLYVTQCAPDGTTQLVWKTTSGGPDAYSRFADPAYTQRAGVFGGCGSKSSNEYPIVVSSLADGDLPAGTYIAKCVARGQAHVYRVTGALEGHPLATWQYPEVHPTCP